MKKKIFSIVAAVAVVAAAGWSYQQSKQYDGMSELALANVEALAGSEISNPGCDPSWDRECCVCFNVHHTYAYANGKNSCETRKNCHY